MDIELIENLLNLISKSDVNELSIEEGELKIQIKKQPDQQGSNTIIQPAPNYGTPNAPAQSQAPAPAPQPAGEPSQPTQQQQPAEETGENITSPIVGTFYRAPSPDSDNFVEVGDYVENGQTVCIVEAMKIMNEIDSEISGKVKKVLVEDGEPVEYDQPLFLIEKT